MWSYGGFYGSSLFRSLYDDGDDFGPNRRNWADKSEAALRRERTAISLFTAFIGKCTGLSETDFPVTEEVVKANTHLTDACWKSFRKTVEARGCKAKRREATIQERIESKDKRKGKLYVISVTCPVHPSKVEEEKKKARLAAERKAQKAKEDREERERLAVLHQTQVKEEYAQIVKGEPVTGNVTSGAVLKHAQSVHEERVSQIRSEVAKEQSGLLIELRKKHTTEERDLRNQMDAKRIKLIHSASEEHQLLQKKIETVCSGVLKKIPASKKQEKVVAGGSTTTTDAKQPAQGTENAENRVNS